MARFFLLCQMASRGLLRFRMVTLVGGRMQWWVWLGIALAAAARLPADEAPQEIRTAIPVDRASLLLTALEAGDRELLDRLLKVGVSVETVLPNGDPPLLYAVRQQRPDLAGVCLDWCARPDATTPSGLTALTLAVVTGQSSLARQLVEAGADPNQSMPAPVPVEVQRAFEQSWFRTQLQHDPGVTPLMLASVLGEEALVQVFLDHGGKPYQRTRRYTTDALTLACRADQIRIGQRLLRRDPDDPTGQKLVVVIGDQRVTLFRGEEEVLTSKVSTGRKGYATPPGDYLITSKHRDWTSTIYKSPMPYLLRLNASAIGLHQGVVPGYPASHGCIRLPAGKAAAFFKTAKIGDRVLIRH